MAVGTTLWTYFNNTWQEGNTAILGAADHATYGFVAYRQY